MDKDFIIDLEKLDCNCNECVYMIRDLERFHSFDALYDKLHGGHKQKWRISYGYCIKFKKKISFTQGQCQLHTQHCFRHLREYKISEERIHL